MKKNRRFLCQSVMILSIIPRLFLINPGAGALAVPEPLPERPVVFANEALSTAQETIWDCVFFGSYPSAEVVKEDWSAVDAYAVLEGDVIRDDRLYDTLTQADWQDSHLSLDGQEYVRINADDAVTVSADREQHYRWNDPDEWHYFVKEPIRWRVLSVDGKEALLLADRLVDCRLFHEKDEAVTWEDSTLRSWLNGYDGQENIAETDYSGQGFFDQAFNPSEQEAVLPTHCVTFDNADYGTDSGEDTEDRVFLLSNEEVYADPVSGEYGFYPGRGYDDPAKRFTSTMYAKCRGTWWSPVDEYKGNSFWFMRTSGYSPHNVTYICDFGFVYSRGTTVTCDDAGILPAIRVDLSLADIVPAGEVSSEDITKKEAVKEEPAEPLFHTPVITEDPSLPGGGAVVWDAVTFGTYPRTEILKSMDPQLWERLASAKWDNDITYIDNITYRRLNGRYFRYDPIRWRVLDVTDDKVLLLADEGLDCFAYHPDLTDVNWKDSAIRSWLNGLGASDNLAELDYSEEGCSFISTAFSKEERKAIRNGSIKNNQNYYFGTDCGDDTEDAVFLLSEEELFSSQAAGSYGFQLSDAIADAAKRFQPTPYALCRGAWKSDLPESEGNGFWFFRTNGYTASNVVYASELGYIFNRGIPVTCADASVVPAVRVDLNSVHLVPDGTISSADKMNN